MVLSATMNNHTIGKAGYQTDGKRSASPNVNTINITNSQRQATLDDNTRAKLQEHAAESIKRLREIVDDRQTAPRDAIAAARTLASLAGYVAPKAQEQRRKATAPAEMSSGELHAFIDQAEAELAARAAPVNAQIDTRSDSEAIDMLE